MVFTWSSPENAVFLPNQTTKHHRFPWSPLSSRTAGMTAPLATQNKDHCRQASGLMRCLGPASSECLATCNCQADTLGPRQLSQHVSHHNYQTQRNPRIEDMGMNQNIWCLQNGIRLDLKPKSPEKFVAAFNRFPHRQDLTGAPRKWPWEVHTAHSWHSVTGTACATSRCWTTTSLTAHRGPLGSLVMPRANGAETIYCQLTWTNVYHHISRERHCGFFIA